MLILASQKKEDLRQRQKQARPRQANFIKKRTEVKVDKSKSI
jgi:hypothetical protein